MSLRSSEEADIAAAAPEKGDEPAAVVKHQSSGQEIAKKAPSPSPPPPGGSRTRDGGKMTVTSTAVVESEERNNGGRNSASSEIMAVLERDISAMLQELTGSTAHPLQDGRSRSTRLAAPARDNGWPWRTPRELNTRIDHRQARGHGTSNHLEDPRLQQQQQQHQQQHQQLVQKPPLLERGRRATSDDVPRGLKGNSNVMDAPLKASGWWLDAEAETASWKGKAEAAQRSFRQMMSQLQTAEQTRMKQAVEISSLRGKKAALEKAIDAAAKELLQTQELLDETRVELSSLRALLRMRHLPRHIRPLLPTPETPHQHETQPQSPWSFANSSPPLSTRICNGLSPREEQTDTDGAFAPVPEGSSSPPVRRSMAGEAVAAEHEFLPPALRASTREGWKRGGERRSRSGYPAEEGMFRRGEC